MHAQKVTSFSISMWGTTPYLSCRSMDTSASYFRYCWLFCTKERTLRTDYNEGVIKMGSDGEGGVVSEARLMPLASGSAFVPALL